MARQRGAEIVGLGAFTSVVTAGGRSLKNEGLPLTTGNSYTAVACAESLHLAMKHRGQTCDRDTRAAIVGATGAIGRSMAMLLAEDVALLTLIGNPESRTDAVMQRLRNVALDVVRHVAAAVDQGFEPHCLAHRIGECLSEVGSDPETVVDILIGEGRVAFSQRIEDVADGHLVVAATSATNALLTADHLRQDAIVCDMSRPMNISREVADQRPDVLVIEGGVIAVPGCPSLGRIGLEYGRAFACMAETIMLTMEGRLENTSLGADISAESLQLLRRLARKHGFRVGELRSFGNAIEVTA